MKVSVNRLHRAENYSARSPICFQCWPLSGTDSVDKLRVSSLAAVQPDIQILEAQC